MTGSKIACCSLCCPSPHVNWQERGSLSCVCTLWTYQLWGQCYIQPHLSPRVSQSPDLPQSSQGVHDHVPGSWHAVKNISKCPQKHLVTWFLLALGKSYDYSKIECIFISGRQSSPPSLINSSFPWMFLMGPSSRILKRQSQKQTNKQKNPVFEKAWTCCFVLSSLEFEDGYLCLCY